ncbi:hypothetical protein ACFQQB_04720 [Nonomuraea rubra]|uniref:hypothetical protein n=1 Tax=Nonomuraea rubra TaxID=46180 RepID=UPI003608BF65
MSSARTGWYASYEEPGLASSDSENNSHRCEVSRARRSAGTSQVRPCLRKSTVGARTARHANDSSACR